MFFKLFPVLFNYYNDYLDQVLNIDLGTFSCMFKPLQDTHITLCIVPSLQYTLQNSHKKDMILYIYRTLYFHLTITFINILFNNLIYVLIK